MCRVGDSDDGEGLAVREVGPRPRFAAHPVDVEHTFTCWVLRQHVQNCRPYGESRVVSPLAHEESLRTNRCLRTDRCVEGDVTDPNRVGDNVGPGRLSNVCGKLWSIGIIGLWAEPGRAGGVHCSVVHPNRAAAGEPGPKGYTEGS